MRTTSPKSTKATTRIGRIVLIQDGQVVRPDVRLLDTAAPGRIIPPCEAAQGTSWTSRPS
jgi:hypothetical protein